MDLFPGRPRTFTGTEYVGGPQSPRVSGKEKAANRAMREQPENMVRGLLQRKLEIRNSIFKFNIHFVRKTIINKKFLTKSIFKGKVHFKEK